MAKFKSLVHKLVQEKLDPTKSFRGQKNKEEELKNIYVKVSNIQMVPKAPLTHWFEGNETISYVARL
jgi:hypothetical protein